MLCLRRATVLILARLGVPPATVAAKSNFRAQDRQQSCWSRGCKHQVSRSWFVLPFLVVLQLHALQLTRPAPMSGEGLQGSAKLALPTFLGGTRSYGGSQNLLGRALAIAGCKPLKGRVCGYAMMREGALSAR